MQPKHEGLHSVLYDEARSVLVAETLEEVTTTAVAEVNLRLPARTTALFLFSKRGNLLRSAISGANETWLTEETYELSDGNILARTIMPRNAAASYGQPVREEVSPETWGRTAFGDAYLTKFPKFQWVASVPLNGPNRTFGAIRVFDKLNCDGNAAPFSDADLSYLITFAAQVSTAVSNLRRKFELDAISELSRMLCDKSQPAQSIYERLTAILVRPWTDYSACVLRLADEKNCLPIISLSCTPGVSCEQKDRTPRKSGEGIVGKVFAEGRSVTIEDVEDHKREFRDLGWLTANSLKGFGCFPLNLNSRTIGTLSIYTLYPYCFFPNKERFISNLGEQIVAATDILRLEQTRKQISSFIEQLISSESDPVNLLHEIVETARHLTGAEMGFIALTSNRDNYLHPSDWTSGVDGKAIPLVNISGRGITALVVRTGQSVNCPDVKEDSRYKDIFVDFEFSSANQIRSELVVPMIYEGRVIGILSMISKQLNRFTDDDQFFLETLGRQATLIYQRKKFYDFATRLSDLMFPRTERAAILIGAQETVAKITELDVIAIYLTDSSSPRTLRLASTSGNAANLTEPPPEIVRLSAGDPVPGDLMNLQILSPRSLSAGETISSFMATNSFGSMVSIPLITVDSSDGGEPHFLGLITAFTVRERAYFSLFSAQTSLLKVLASSTSIALDDSRLIEKLEFAYARAERTQKIVSVAEIAAGVAHDTFNLLNIASTSFGIIETEIDRSTLRNNQKLHNAIDNLGQNLDKITSYFQRLRHYARFAKPVFGEFDLNEIVSESLELLAYRIDKMKVRLRTEMRGLPSIRCDKEHLLQAIANIIANALDAMKERGTLFVGTESLGNRVRLRVTDDGSGIDEKDRARIFEPFFTTKEETGTGLGLTLAKQIVEELHEGNVDFETRRGKGSTFYLTFPVGQ